MVKMLFDKIIVVVLIFKSYHQHEANGTGEFFFLVRNFFKNNY